MIGIAFIGSKVCSLTSFVTLLGIPSSAFTAPLSIDAYLNHDDGVEESSSMIRVIHPGVLDDIFELRRKVNDEKLLEY